MNFQKVGICLTQVAPICSMRAWRRNIPKSDRARKEFRDRGSVPGISGPAAVAGGLPLPTLRWRPVVAGPRSSAGVRGLWLPNFGDSRNDLPGHANPFAGLVPRHVVGATQKNGASALGLQRVLGLRSYEIAWAWLHKLRRAMVRPGRDRLTGRVEVDECYVGGPEEGLPGRLNFGKGPGCCCCTRGWTWDRSDSHAPDHRRVRRKSRTIRAGLGRTREYHPHRRMAGLPAIGEERL